MGRKDEKILEKLLPMFKIEAREHLEVISSGLIEIEKSGSDKRADIIEAIYRESHSLKGAAGSVNLSRLVAICQAMESVFSALKRKEIVCTSNIFDLLHRAVDLALKMVAGEELSSSDKTSIGELVKRLEGVAQEPGLSTSKGTGGKFDDIFPEKKAQREGALPASRSLNSSIPKSLDSSDQALNFSIPRFLNSYVRISAGKLDSLLLQAEEMLSIKIAAGRLAGELKELNGLLGRWKKDRMRRKSSTKAVGLELKGEKERSDDMDSFVASLESRLANMIKSAEYDQRSFGAMVDSLLDDTKKTLMLPLGSLLEIFPKLVRDLSRDAGKEVELAVSGGEIELDRRVLEQIKDPLVHLVRNCIDHGIETPDERKAKNKPLCGKISIAGFSRDSRIEIAVSDDGAGIDPVELKNAGERSGAISREESDRLDEKEALSLIFYSGITTSPIITDLSGRGLGLAIAKERVEKLNGAVAVDTQPDVGTTIRMIVPLTLATFRGVLVRVGEHLFLLPSAKIEKVARVRREEIQTVENRETITFDGRPISLAKLGAVLELQTNDAGSRAENSYVQFVVLGSAGKCVAFQVDEIIHEQEVLVKNLGPQLLRVRNTTGAALLGSGKVVPILNVHDLMISVTKIAPTPRAAVVGETSKQVSVLVAEDSITSRALLKTILESAGYLVTTAVDGLDAFTALKSGEFDIVVSDIEMPKMNGFDLTARIRADGKLSEVPVVLVTALESREDKERGIDVGANAYVVKSSFEQSNLLEVIRRLL